MSIFFGQYYKIFFPLLFLIVGFGVFALAQEARADYCSGYEYVDGEWLSTGWDCSFNCVTLQPASCGGGPWNPNDPVDNPKECTGIDEFGSGGEGADGIGDTSHHCGDIAGVGYSCDNIFVRGNPLGSSCIGQYEFPGCPWVRGSYAKRHQYCTMTTYPSILNAVPGNTCDNNTVYSPMTIYQSHELPGIHEVNAAPVKGGFCADYCRETIDYVVDYEPCYEGGSEYNYVTGWSNTYCYFERYNNTCSGADVGGPGNGDPDGIGDTLEKRTCDGELPEPFDFSGTTFIDGLDVDPTNYVYEDCGDGTPAVCYEECGTPSNPVNDYCRGQAAGYCQPNGSGDTCEQTGWELDLSEEMVNLFYDDCPAMTDNVIWSQGATALDHGEYRNRAGIKILFDGGPENPDNHIRTRDLFQTEACGDDQDEISVGTYCCNVDRSDRIEFVADQIIDDVYRYRDWDGYTFHELPVDMSGDYCVSATGCGNFVLDSGEDCDVARGEFKDWGTHWEDNYKFIGDDSNCTGDGNYCVMDSSEGTPCTCFIPIGPTCDPADYNSIAQQLEINTGSTDLFHIDTQGMVLLSGNVVENGIGAYTEPAYIVRAGGIDLMVIDTDGTLWLRETLHEGTSDFSVIANQKLIIQSGSTVLAVVDALGNLYIRDCIVANHSF